VLQLRRDLGEREENELPLRDLGMGDLEGLRAQDLAVEEQRFPLTRFLPIDSSMDLSFFSRSAAVNSVSSSMTALTNQVLAFPCGSLS
jgi:hypothetical protein